MSQLVVEGITESEEDKARRMTFGVCQLTVDELFHMVRDGKLSADSTHYQIRERAIELTDHIYGLLYEKTISSLAHGRKQVSIWNNLLEGAKMEFDTCELAHQSVCSEGKITRMLP